MHNTFLMYLTFFLNNTDMTERQKIQCKLTVHDSYSHIKPDILKSSGGMFTGDFECILLEMSKEQKFEYIKKDGEESSSEEYSDESD